jgi:hypothetical protein
MELIYKLIIFILENVGMISTGPLVLIAVYIICLAFIITEIDGLVLLIQYRSILPLDIKLLSIFRLYTKISITQPLRFIDISDRSDDIVDDLVNIIHSFI